MTIVITCPHCGGSLRVREEHAGRKVQCPQCAKEFEAPVIQGGMAEAVTENKPPAKSPPVLQLAEGEEDRPRSRTQTCPECGERVSTSARRCPACRAYLDDEDEYEDDDYRPRRGSFKPCPRCGSRSAHRVTWTPWGSFYGPALFTHVRCDRCGCGYNGRTGGSNLIPAILFVTIPLILIVAIIGGLGFALLSMR